MPLRNVPSGGPSFILPLYPETYNYTKEVHPQGIKRTERDRDESGKTKKQPMHHKIKRKNAVRVVKGRGKRIE